MNIAFENLNKTLVIKIKCDIDHHTCEDIRQRIDNEIISRNPKNIIFDMDNVGFMDSSGIGVIIGRYKLVAGNGGKAAMINLKPQVKRIYDICGLRKIIPVYKDKKQAVESI